MQNEYYYVIGLMSGTSLDGLDIVYVKFDKNEYKNFQIIYSDTYEYSDKWKSDLKGVINLSKERINQLDIDYGEVLGEMVNRFVSQYKIENIDFIASHGHTVFHQPDKGITLQIGDGQTLANSTKQKIICDFRTQDVERGGQGAPLVPIGDELLFSEYDYCLNLGGFANVSFKKGNQRIAFDICAVNIVLNKYANLLGYEYDDKGSLANSGNYVKDLDQNLRSLSFYNKKPPKSLGLEWVKKEIFPKLESEERKPEDLLKTYTEHAAWAIANTFPVKAKVLITGGGVFNEYLLLKIKENKNIAIIIPDNTLIAFKEALIFAFLGVLKVDNQMNCLRSVTGADEDHSSGVVFYPNN